MSDLTPVETITREIVRFTKEKTLLSGAAIDGRVYEALLKLAKATQVYKDQFTQCPVDDPDAEDFMEAYARWSDESDALQREIDKALTKVIEALQR